MECDMVELIQTTKVVTLCFIEDQLPRATIAIGFLHAAMVRVLEDVVRRATYQPKLE